MSAHDLKNLDRYEGYYGAGKRNAYDRKVCTLKINGESKRVRVYVVQRKRKGLKPSAEYMEGIIFGAKKHKLPTDYIRFLKGIETK